MKVQKEAVSLVITDKNGSFLIVKRPNDPNDDLAGVWGLPAVSLHEGEDHGDAAARVGQQKLGIDINLGPKIGSSTHDRQKYMLKLTDYKATIVQGIPTVPQSDQSVTQYIECKFSDDPSILVLAAQCGSQCTQIFLDSLGIDWQNTGSR